MKILCCSVNNYVASFIFLAGAIISVGDLSRVKIIRNTGSCDSIKSAEVDVKIIFHHWGKKSGLSAAELGVVTIPRFCSFRAVPWL